jgi:hypothetical protein
MLDPYTFMLGTMSEAQGCRLLAQVAGIGETPLWGWSRLSLRNLSLS